MPNKKTKSVPVTEVPQPAPPVAHFLMIKLKSGEGIKLPVADAASARSILRDVYAAAFNGQHYFNQEKCVIILGSEVVSVILTMEQSK